MYLFCLFICRVESFKGIECCISLRCKHYFCEKCLLGRGKKTTRCFVCNAPATIFKPANNLIARLKILEQEKPPESDKSAESDESAEGQWCLILLVYVWA